MFYADPLIFLPLPPLPSPPPQAMVAATATMASWLLPSDRKRSKPAATKPKDTNPKHHTKPFFWTFNNNNENNNGAKPTPLGILAFDAAKTINNLISLYRSLSDPEIARLRRNVISSRGVAYLNSDDESFLLALACAERLEELDRSANSVTRLGSRCADTSLSRFDLVYRDLKLGYVDIDKLYISGSKEIEKCLEKTERRISATSNLYSELEALSNLEASERRLNEWKQNVASAAAPAAAGAAAEAAHAASVEAFEAKIAAQRKVVRQLKEGSLWGQTFDKTVGFAARITCVVFARMCAHFGPYVAVLPQVKSRARGNKIERESCHEGFKDCPDMLERLFDDPELSRVTQSGPIVGSGLSSFGLDNHTKANLVRFTSRDSPMFGGFGLSSTRPRNRVFLAAPPSTVGGSGLASRYAKIITLVEKYINSSYVLGEQARKELYDMLPGSLRAQVRSKLKKSWREVEVDEAMSCGAGHALAVGWREAVEELLEWLGPIARDTLTWQDERSLETQRFDSQPTVLLMQTLHFSDLEKAEAAIGVVLVGLSCIYRYENRPLVDGDCELDGSCFEEMTQ